jgi:hypothetical protein
MKHDYSSSICWNFLHSGPGPQPALSLERTLPVDGALLISRQAAAVSYLLTWCWTTPCSLEKEEVGKLSDCTSLWFLQSLVQKGGIQFREP